MEETEKKVSPYALIINEYIKMVNGQMKIVPISNNIMVAKLLSDSKKILEFGIKNGKLFKQDCNEGIRMSVDHSIVLGRMMRDLNTSVLAYGIIGVNAVIGMVSKYDGFLGALTRQLFEDRPEILNGSDRDVKVTDIMAATNLNELKEVIIEKEIETLLRKSHTEQLKTLESKLSMEIKPQKLLPDFVEIMERRNLFVHSNGIVSRQYLSECKKYEYQVPEGVKVGEYLDADHEYVVNAYKVLFQIGIRLASVLWYKLRPEEGEELVDTLSNVAYDLIKDEEYELALGVIDFALTNKSWAKEIKNAQQLIFRVNKALAFHLRDMQEECNKIVDSMDVTAAESKYHLAVAILKKEYDRAYEIMKQIGDNKQMIVSYKTWPLFNIIRKEQGFADTFKEIYNEEYECNDDKLSNYEEVIKSAMDIVANSKQEKADLMESLIEMLKIGSKMPTPEVEELNNDNDEDTSERGTDADGFEMV